MISVEAILYGEFQPTGGGLFDRSDNRRGRVELASLLTQAAAGDWQATITALAKHHQGQESPLIDELRRRSATSLLMSLKPTPEVAEARALIERAEELLCQARQGPFDLQLTQYLLADQAVMVEGELGQVGRARASELAFILCQESKDISSVERESFQTLGSWLRCKAGSNGAQPEIYGVLVEAVKTLSRSAWDYRPDGLRATMHDYAGRMLSDLGDTRSGQARNLAICRIADEAAGAAADQIEIFSSLAREDLSVEIAHREISAALKGQLSISLLGDLKREGSCEISALLRDVMAAGEEEHRLAGFFDGYHQDRQRGPSQSKRLLKERLDELRAGLST